MGEKEFWHRNHKRGDGMTTPLSYFLDTDAPFKHEFVQCVKDTNFLNMTEKQRADFWGTDVCTFAFSMFSKSIEWHQKQTAAAYPEFAKYLPEEVKPTKNLPALAGVVDALKRMGWNK